MRLSKKQLFEDTLLSSLAHAIMTNVYPELSYEQTWDGRNYSVQNSSGLRGTVTFLDTNCIGAIRNDNHDIVYGEKSILSLMKQFPKGLIDIALSDTLQYLLDYHEGESMPAVTSIFWCDEKGLYWASESWDCFRKDFSLFRTCGLPEGKAIELWKEYYSMDSASLRLLRELWTRKTENSEERIILSNRQKGLIPGEFLLEECIESFLELGIYV